MNIFNKFHLAGGVVDVVNNLLFVEISHLIMLRILSIKRHQPKFRVGTSNTLEYYISFVKYQAIFVPKNHITSIVAQFNNRNQSLIFQLRDNVSTSGVTGKKGQSISHVAVDFIVSPFGIVTAIGLRAF